jgi:hypothetical protein
MAMFCIMFHGAYKVLYIDNLTAFFTDFIGIYHTNFNLT